MDMKALKEALDFKKNYKIHKNILCSILILDLIGIGIMLFDYLVYGKNFWNSTTYGLIFSVLFLFFLYKICIKRK